MSNGRSSQVRVGLFDSGIGGLSILKDIIALLPQVNYFYLADQAFAPYGKLTTAQVIARSEVCAQWLIEKAAVDILVVACNTATAESIGRLRELYPKFPIVGVEPYVNVINKEQHLFSDRGRVAVLTTPLLAKSARFLSLLQSKDPQGKIRVVACPSLAKIVEEVFVAGMTEILKKQIVIEMQSLQLIGQLDYAILGCTHYPLIAKTMEEILQAQCLGPGQAVANRVKNLLASINEERNADSCSSSLETNPSSNDFFYFSTAEKDQTLWDREILTQWPK